MRTGARSAVLVLIVAGFLAVSIAPASAAPDEEGGNWFTKDVRLNSRSSSEPVPGLVRSRSVAFDAASALRSVISPESLALAEPGTRVVVPKRGDLSLTLFDGRTLPFQVVEVAVTLEAESASRQPMVEVIGQHAVGGAAVAAGSFTFIPNEGGEYEVLGGVDPGERALRVEIRQSDGAIAELAEMQLTAQPDEGDDVLAPPVAPAADQAPDSPPLAQDAGVIPVVDVVVGYERSLGRSALAEIGRRVAETNDAFVRSQANARVALVSVIAVDYTQSPGTLSDDIERLRKGESGLNALQNRRASLNADLVALVVPQQKSSCGVAYVPDVNRSREFGVSVTAWDCLRQFTLSHELGHNLGANHDRENAGALTGVPFSFSYGYRVPGVNSTVMAYTNCLTSCPRALQFSNPAVGFLDHPSTPSGSATANNARSISLMAPVVSRYGVAAATTRVAGSDRFETAAAISRHGYPDAAVVNTVLVATGMEFPDALSAAPLAAKLGGPLLLSGPDTLGAATSAEIARLKPSKVLVVGGTAVLTSAVEAELRRLVPSAAVQRLSGADRYQTSLAVVEYGWATTDTAFLATGAGFPDALSAGAAAGMRGAPVVLVQGTMTAVHDQAAAYLKKAGVKNIHIAGATAVVTASMEADLKAKKYSVTRYGGNDRFSTSALIAQANHTVGGRMYLASASNFPDALAGAAVAGKNKAPLILSAPGCVLTDIQDLRAVIKPSAIVLLGGVAILSQAVEEGQSCT